MDLVTVAAVAPRALRQQPALVCLGQRAMKLTATVVGSVAAAVGDHPMQALVSYGMRQNPLLQDAHLH